ncbi:hypothetical protein M3643_13840, partial [Staphylococcus lugdunensis]|nr:hypothetical protein [Staphylococcus lugdunensis]
SMPSGHSAYKSGPKRIAIRHARQDRPDTLPAVCGAHTTRRARPSERLRNALSLGPAHPPVRGMQGVRVSVTVK